jgi:hypothetical protein
MGWLRSSAGIPASVAADKAGRRQSKAATAQMVRTKKEFMTRPGETMPGTAWQELRQVDRHSAGVAFRLLERL